ncbi:hypothetical protein COEREDRAFT_16638 [Coemansia reversa NRRL 1564]|uniref:tRNA-splicing endonuclease subunit Sen54 N-terminal domain-containing protein n=1 Tax=Coemansia reversa (strain ATCC 12441 / NRRL 1564) TaxID=763665 RepID=A0A2G5B6W2_COERN|nr:hypothetical protein COEREDRAFT_16638 [Coemansia reversa NRRL 1564]|eukprot:PIA14783.1 hypothetical protein COEREDRAFT_16638 [Coemansia reversa NRRL 1564]
MNDAFDDDDHAGLALFMTDVGDGAANSISDTTCGIPGKIYLPQEGEDERRRIDTLLFAYYRMLNVPPKKSRRTCVARSQIGQTLAAVDRPLNVISRTFGQTIGGILYLQPEEWLLFFERGSLIMYYYDEQAQEHRLDGLNVWTHALGDTGLDMDLYRGYAYLRRLGYVVCQKGLQDVAEGVLKSERTHRQQQHPHRLLPLPAFSYGNVFRGLVYNSPYTAFPCSGYDLSQADDSFERKDNMDNVYHVYKPNHPYKKKSPLPPEYHMAVKHTSQRFPTARELYMLTRAKHKVPTILGASEPGNIAFLEVQAFEMPPVFHQ